MAESIKERLRSDLNNARRERDKLRTQLLTTTLSELKNREIELGHELSDAEVVDVVQRAVKRRREAIEQFRIAERAELAEKEEAEAKLLGAYLPAQMSEEEVRAIVKTAIGSGASTIGAIMQAIMPQIKGKFDGKEANRIVNEELKSWGAEG
jgi:uncharacterized protein